MYSIEEILELVYRIDFLRERGIAVDEMDREEMYEEVDNILFNDIEISDNFEDKEKVWIGNKTKKISEILDAIVGKENRKLIYENRCQKVFTIEDCAFILNLFVTYNIEDCKGIRKRQYNRVSQEYIDFIYKGVTNLANNENLKLTLQEVKEIWERKYNKSIDAFIDDCQSFFTDMEYIFHKALEIYVMNMENEQKAEYSILNKVRLELTKCRYSISELDEEFEKIIIWK